MKTNLLISGRGQITLPSEIRKKYKIVDGGVIVLEERNGELVLKPAQVIEVDYYDDKQIDDWISEDELSAAERKTLQKKLSPKRKG
ncbi:MAG: AbrB/MazE/SpoVT family DNA-binding domain-containing protein [Bdellovibrio sp.]